MLTSAQRFDAKHEQRDAGYVTLCWVWTAALNRHGYGSFRPGGTATCIGAHIWNYKRSIGSVPEGLELDHLCRNRACVRPDHLEPVTPQENVLRGETFAAENAAKTHCPDGHPFDDTNTIVLPAGRGRACRACRIAHKRSANNRAKTARAIRSHCPKGHALTLDNLVGGRVGGGCLTCRRRGSDKLIKTQCDNGHEIVGTNALARGNGRSRCRICTLAKARDSYAIRSTRAA